MPSRPKKHRDMGCEYYNRIHIIEDDQETDDMNICACGIMSFSLSMT